LEGKKKKKRVYNIMKEHNYFNDSKKKSCRWPDGSINCTEKIKDYDEHDSKLEWYLEISSSDDDEDVEDKPLSYLLKREFEKDLIKQSKIKICSNDSKSLNENQLCDESTNKNNHSLLNTSNYSSNNIISENHVINDGKQSKIVQIVPLTNTATIIQNQKITNESQTKLLGQSCKELNYKRANIDLNDSNEQTFSSSSSDTNNAIFGMQAHSSYNNVTKTSPKNVCPPFQWIHLIYLAIKNSATENVTCVEIQKFVRYWFPYFKNQSYIGFINFLVDRLNYSMKNFFRCNALPIIDKENTWTINSVHIDALEKSLMTVVENNEYEIKSAMTNPDKLSVLINGYSVLHLGFSQNF
ncbi:LOW QUALITY PROTEIN: forkhead box protein N4-like, partial [Melanaphis sacchari]|uniref:LOW QUALITY PROTEIN: forkhead box protein N4-like n=1 Tax=Melanaphis sacchari TaxID=742174 RepID=UPI000DC12D28